MLLHGWYQVAFERDLNSPLVPVLVGETPVLLVRNAETVRAFDGICPHRGANLAIGGQLLENAILCPFHHFKISLVSSSTGQFCLQEFPTLMVGGLVFVRLSSQFENGLTQLLSDLDQSAYFIPGFTTSIDAPAELIIENAFDGLHFQPVHGTYNCPKLTRLNSQWGEFRASSLFELPPSPWQKAHPASTQMQVPYVAQAFSPGVVVSSMAGKHPYQVITSATPTSTTSSIVRLSIVVSAHQQASPEPDLCRYLLQQCKAGIEKDRVIWENMKIDTPCQFDDQDDIVKAFQAYCQSFRETSSQHAANKRTTDSATRSTFG